jgi:hypothetical protein
MNIDECKLIKFKEFADTHGNLVAIEGVKDVPFNIRLCHNKWLIFDEK